MFWSAGVLKVVADLCTVTSPLVIRALINFATNSYYAHHSGTPLPSVGRGIGLGFVLWALQVITAFCTHQFFGRSGTSGVLARGALIAAIYRRSLVLSQRSRMTITNGHLINHISEFATHKNASVKSIKLIYQLCRYRCLSHRLLCYVFPCTETATLVRVNNQG